VTLQGLGGGRYRVEEVLGSGGMAVVYAARDEELHRDVAVKLLADNLAEDPEFRERFLREARLAARLSHPNVVRVFDAGADGGRPYIVMELVRGETLADVLRREGRLDPAEVTRIGRQAAAGLAHAHAHGLVHRDVKPQNLLLREDGVVKVADFGIARPATATQRLTEVGAILGTAAYLAPEQAHGQDVSATADVYSLGVVLYECLTGRTPYRGDTLAQLLTAQERDAAEPVSDLAPGVPPQLEETVMRCLARNPEYRPASAAAVERMLAGAPASARTRVLARRPRRRRAAVAAAAVLAAGAIAGGVVAATSGGGSTKPLPPDRPNHPAQQARDLADWLRSG
jgi:serine/threonine protein kinase